MFRRSGTGRAGSGSTSGAGEVGSGSPAPGLDSLLTTGPHFPVRVHGYDRLEVDNYVAWVESELAVARGEAEHLLARYGACAAELEISRRLLAEAPKGRDVSPVTDRVRDILRLAADEASSMVESAGQEAGQILAEARTEADDRLRKAHEIKEAAAATADEMRALAHQDRTEAAAVLERARAEVDNMVGRAAAERDRLAAEAVEARDALAALRPEIEDLHRQQDDARSALLRLTEQIESALSLASAGPSEKFLLVCNTVADSSTQSAPRVTVAS